MDSEDGDEKFDPEIVAFSGPFGAVVGDTSTSELAILGHFGKKYEVTLLNAICKPSRDTFLKNGRGNSSKPVPHLRETHCFT